jgi:hypothetical protein
VSAGAEQGLRRNRFRDPLTAPLARWRVDLAQIPEEKFGGDQTGEGSSRWATGESRYRFVVIERACMRHTPMVSEGVCRM